MAFNGSGTFLVNSAGQPVVTNTTITTTAFNAFTADIATGLSNVICKDGQTTVTANIPMSNHKLTGLAAATTSGDALSYSNAAVVSSLQVNGGDTITTFASGTFTPTDQSGATLAFTVNRAVYTQIGTRVWVELTLTFPNTANGSSVNIGLGALPNCANVSGVSGMWSVYFGGAVFLMGYMTLNTNTFSLYDSAGSVQHNNGLSLATIRMQFNYSTV